MAQAESCDGLGEYVDGKRWWGGLVDFYNCSIGDS